MLQVLSSAWALLLGMGLLMIGNGLQGTLLGVRGEIEGFSTLEMSFVMSAYFLGFLGGSRFGTRDDPARGPCARVRGFGFVYLGRYDHVSDADRPNRVVAGPRDYRFLLLGRVCDSRKLAEQRGQQREPRAGAVALHDRADGGCRECAGPFAGW